MLYFLVIFIGKIFKKTKDLANIKFNIQKNILNFYYIYFHKIIYYFMERNFIFAGSPEIEFLLIN